MMMNLYLLSLLLCLHVQGRVLNRGHHQPPDAVEWTPCEFNNFTTTLCGTLSVPLDYADNESDATLELELLKIPAAKTPSRGSIMFNFGGPGGNSLVGLAGLGPLLMPLSGGEYDLVTWNTRGTGNTLRFSCYETDEDRRADQYSGFTISADESDTALGTLWAQSKIFGQRCHHAQNETGELIGTAFSVRDMMRIVDALDADGLLRYWGFSYGTVLGATAAAMFPDRMDKVILDGVVNPHEYYHGYETEMFADTDSTFTEMLSRCIASPEICPLGQNRTLSSLQSDIYSLLDTLKDNPIPLYSPDQYSYVVTASVLESYIMYALKAPSEFPAFSVVLDGLLKGNTTLLFDFLGRFIAEPPASIDFESFEGIKCSDMFDRSETKEGIRLAVDKRHALSSVAGGVGDYVVGRCAQWPMEAKERYDGDFRVKTRRPVLLIGNTWDPVTPLVSARNSSEALEGSVVLEHGAIGHTTIVQASLCTAKAIRSYFVNGTLPEPGTVCSVEGMPWTGGWGDVLAQLLAGE